MLDGAKRGTIGTVDRSTGTAPAAARSSCGALLGDSLSTSSSMVSVLNVVWLLDVAGRPIPQYEL